MPRRVNAGILFCTVLISAVIGTQIIPDGDITIAADAGQNGIISITPVRLYDSRKGIGPLAASPDGTTHAIPTGEHVTAALAARGHDPESVRGVYLNLTVVNPSAAGFVVLHTSDTRVPDTSIINFGPGVTLANSGIVPLRDDTLHATAITPGEPATLDLIVDLLGVIINDETADDTAQRPSRLAITEPRRVLDTRRLSPVGPSEIVTVNLGTTNPTMVNLTLVNDLPDSEETFLSPVTAVSGQPRDVSLVNARAGEIRANNSLLVPDANGDVRLWNGAGSTHVLVDTFAELRDDGSGGRIVMLDEPFRVLDTRPDPLGPGQAEDWDLTDFIISVDSAARSFTPSEVTAAIGNLTATGLERRAGPFPTSSFLTVYAGTGRPPDVSNLNVPERTDIANGGIFPLKNARLSVYNDDGNIHYLMDVTALVVDD